MDRSVLLVTHREDHFTVDRVAEAVARRGRRPIRVDSDRFPLDVTLTLGPAGLDDGALTLPDDGAVALDGVDAVWIRRVWAGRGLADRVDPRFLAACQRDARTLFRALLARLEARARFVNSFERTLVAEEKPLQLELARGAGLSVPPTLITNDPARVRAFHDAMDGRVITKLLGPLSQSMTASGDFLYTTRVGPRDLEALHGLAFGPQIFQREIAKVRELRVVVIGERVFTGALDVRGGGPLDWRARPDDGAHAFVAATLDDALVAALRRLLDAQGLVSGVIDLVEDADGALWFLEVNPAGEWGFLERDLGFPIADAFADALVGDRP